MLSKAFMGGLMGTALGVGLFVLVEPPAHAVHHLADNYAQSSPVPSRPFLSGPVHRLTGLEADEGDYRHRIPAWSKPQRQLRSLGVTATAYNNVPSQTDDTPDIAAWGDTIAPGMRLIAVSRDLLKEGLKRGTKVRISGIDGEFVVLDKMNKRYKKRIDIYMGKNLQAARNFGRKTVTINWLDDPEPTLIAQR